MRVTPWQPLQTQVFLSPALLLLFMGGENTSALDVGPIFLKLALTVIVPMVLGEIVQYFFPKAVAWLRAHVNFTIVSQCALLLFVYAIFCDTFSEQLTLVSLQGPASKQAETDYLP